MTLWPDEPRSCKRLQPTERLYDGVAFGQKFVSAEACLCTDTLTLPELAKELPWSHKVPYMSRHV